MEFGMLAHHWNGSLEQVQGWYASRKYNGWSALWDGGITRGMLAEEVPWYYKGKDRPIVSTGLWTLGRTPNSNEIKPKVIQAPSYFLNKLPPNIPVHGEISYLDKNGYDRLHMVKRVCGMKFGYNPLWYSLKFRAFHVKPYSLWEGIKEIPLYNDKNLFINAPWEIITEGSTFLKSYNYLCKFINEIFCPIILLHITNNPDLEWIIGKAIRNKWEGLMFANPTGKYECKRSHNNLKWKPDYETEAVICGYEKGKTGKNLGLVGALKATMVWNDKVISIHGGESWMVGKEANFCIGGLTDKERDWEECQRKYPLGTKIKFKFDGVSNNGIPQSCNIYRKE